MKKSNLWCIYYYPCGNFPNSLIVKKQICKNLDLVCKVVKVLESIGNRVSSIEKVDCIIDF